MRLKTLVVSGLSVLMSLALVAQEHPQMSAEQMKMMEAWQKAATPGDPHKALNGMVGTWDTVVRFYQAPGAPAQESTGVSENRWILGGRYLEQKFTGSVMGAPFEGIGYTGYDNIRKQYVGSWIDNMSTAMMNTTGKMESPTKWKFTGSMDDPLTGKAQPMEETITVNSPDKHTFEMRGPGPDGKMFKTMEIVYTRKK